MVTLRSGYVAEHLADLFQRQPFHISLVRNSALPALMMAILLKWLLTPSSGGHGLRKNSSGWQRPCAFPLYFNRLIGQEPPAL